MRNRRTFPSKEATGLGGKKVYLDLLYSTRDVVKACTEALRWSCWDRTDLKATWELGPTGHGVGHGISASAPETFWARRGLSSAF